MKKLKKSGLEKIRFSPPSCVELLKRFSNKEIFPNTEKLEFAGVGKRDVYNISKPFFINNEQIIAGRVEAREDVAKSQIVFFKHEKGLWVPVYGAPTFQLEDSSIVKIGDELIFSGIEVYPNPSLKDPRNLDYRTVFYRGLDLLTLKKFAVGPELMKDIRLVPLTNGHIGVFTRPQGGEYGKGKIGFMELNNIKEINPKTLLQAQIIENQFSLEEWGGVNDAHSFKNWVYAIGHIAYIDEKNAKHYYAMSFIYNIASHVATQIKIVATKKNFPAGGIKTPEHEDVAFPTGLVWNRDNTSKLIMNLSDAEVYVAGVNNTKAGIVKKQVYYIFKNEN